MRDVGEGDADADAKLGGSVSWPVVFGITCVAGIVYSKQHEESQSLLANNEITNKRETAAQYRDTLETPLPLVCQQCFSVEVFMEWEVY